MITLNDLLAGVTVVSSSGSLPAYAEAIKGLTSDSRQAGRGMVFVALEGSEQDGHRFVADACARGCLAVVIEKDQMVPEGAVVVKVADSHHAYGLMAAAYHGHPGRKMNLIGLTGTNGKTTTSWILEKVLQEDGRNTGVIGTVNYRFAGSDGRETVRDAPLTTPEPVVLQQLLREMADSGVTDVIMEVSSHALAQKRLAGTMFDIAVFTNLSRDHLDYHRTMEEYFAAKCCLFLEHLKEDGAAVVVMDKPAREKKGKERDWNTELLHLLQANGFSPFAGKRKNRSYITCGFDKNCVVSADISKQDVEGFFCRMDIGGKSLNFGSKLIGRHNVLNVVAAAGAAYGACAGMQAIGRGLRGVDRVPGRLERVDLPPYGTAGGGPNVFVDYAHTPDALEKVLQTLRQLTSGRLICVFGCGGDRDRGKRPLMGQVAGKLADRILVTSDNPRRENPPRIMEEIEQGLMQARVMKTDAASLMEEGTALQQYALLEDRRQAIHTVCSMAVESDVVLIAGKGHETYQITGQGKRFFDDRLEAQNGRLCWSVRHLLSATSGNLVQRGTVTVSGSISTDTRNLQPGDVFLALKGDNFNGHDFLAEAVRKGAAALVVSEQGQVAESRVGIIRVDDTLKALGDLAGYRRQALAPRLKVVGITGSSGKTTVKEMVAAVFAEQYAGTADAVLKTKGNFNNLVGLPLSLLEARAGHRTAVLEMGMNRPGEIRRLTVIADPDVGCITNVQPAHLEGLGSVEGVARAKGELFAAMSDRGIRVVNCDDRHIRSMGGYHGNNIVGFAVTPAGRRHRPAVRATRIRSLGESGMRFTLHIGTWRRRINVPATGAHNVANCAAAAAVATAAGVEPELIVRGLVRYRSGDKRLQVTDLPGGIKVLNDAYNANPSSMAAALHTVRGFGQGCRRIAVLGDMLELGDAAALSHRQIGALVAKLGFDYLGVTGNFAGEAAEGACRAGMKKNRIRQGESTDVLAQWLAGLIADQKVRPGDWLLVKGSRGMRMERVLESLEELLQQEK